MEFGATPDIYTEFNFYEAIFWFLVGGTWLLLVWSVPKQYQRLLFFSAGNIVLFGVTDVIELYTGGFLYTAQWLLVWKVIHVVGLVVSVIWYLKLRLQKDTSNN